MLRVASLVVLISVGVAALPASARHGSRYGGGSGYSSSSRIPIMQVRTYNWGPSTQVRQSPKPAPVKVVAKIETPQSQESEAVELAAKDETLQSEDRPPVELLAKQGKLVIDEK